MKIVSISAHVVNAEMRNWVFVKVQTDVPGLHGWGEATLEWKTRGVAGAIEDLAPLVVGRDPLDIEQAVRAMRKHLDAYLGQVAGAEHLRARLIRETDAEVLRAGIAELGQLDAVERLAA